MNQQHRQPTNARLLPVNRASNRHTWQLMSHIVPLLVLSVAACWWMIAMRPAMAQFPNQPTTSTPFQPINQNFSTGAAPTIPASAIPSTEFQPTAAEQPAEESGWELPGFFEKLSEGGWLMLPLAVCCLVVFSLSIERTVALRRARVIPRPFVRRFTECVEDGQLSYEEATELCEEYDCPVAEVFRAAVRRWGRPMFEVEQAVMDAGDRVADGLRRFLRVFHAISNVAPLIGLLGTVLGMINSFDTISSQASLGQPESLASGISVALMTTAGGLTVAIPAYLAYMYFSSKSDSYLNEIDKLCQRVVDCISAEGLENAGGNRTNRKRRAA